jgi:chromosome segregation ATPase
MKTHNGLLIGSGFCCISFCVRYRIRINQPKDAAMLHYWHSSALIAHTLTDSIAQKRINQADERVKRLERELESALSKTAFLEDIEARSQHLAEEIDKVRSALDLAIGEHQKAADFNLYLQQTLTTLQADLEASQGKVEELEAECQVWEEEFSDRVSTEADAKFQQAKKAEIERIFQEHDAITSQAIALFQRLQGWGEKVAHGHQTKREIIKNLAASYNANLEELGESVEKERGHYLQQIELLHEKIGRLQHELAGDLVEPEYGQFGFRPKRSYCQRDRRMAVDS